MVTVSAKAWRAEGSRMFIEPKKAVTVDELLHGVIVQSGNDAAIALAETVAGSEEAFVERMNREAARMGMKNTHFATATGLPAPQQVSTANDLALLAAAIIRDFPEYYPLYSIKEYRYNNITQPNRNRLLWSDPYVDGMKTGNTDAAGYCLIASAKRGPRRLLAVVLGAGSDAARASEAQKLLNYGFQFYDTVQLYQNGQTVSTLRVWKGATDSVAAGFVADQYVTLPKGQAQKLKLTLEAVEPLVAPVARGQRVGVVRVTLDGKPVGEYPLAGAGRRAAGELVRPRVGYRAAVDSRSERADAQEGALIHDRLSQRPVPAARRREDLGARSRVHLRRRRLRVDPRLRARALSPAAASRAAAAQPRRHPARQSAYRGRMGSDHPRADRAACPSPIRASISR